MARQARLTREQAFAELPAFLFRGDKHYRQGPLGIPLDSEEALRADLQDPAEHVLRKEAGRTSIYSSFTARWAVAARFADLRWIIKAKVQDLQRLEAAGQIRLLLPWDAYDLLRRSGPRLAKQAGPTRDYMLRNAEMLIEGQIPAKVMRKVKQKRRR